MQPNDPELKYLRLVAQECASECDMDEDGELCFYESMAPGIFISRLGGKAKFPFTYEEYLGKEDIIGTLNGYGLDVEKFWYALLFIYDYTQCECVNVQTLTPNYAITQLQGLCDYLTDCENLTLKAEGKKKMEITNKDALMVLRDIVTKGVTQVTDNPFLSTFKPTNPAQDLYPNSVQMWYATKRYLKLFENLQLPDQRAKYGEPKYEEKWGKRYLIEEGKEMVSYNKMLLISRIVHLYKMTDNPSFLDDDNSLKGIMKQYKNFTLDTFNHAYF